MIAETRCCEHCKSTNIVKNGKNRSGTQTYKCKDCGCFRVLGSKQPSRRPDSGVVERTFLKRQSVRATARTLGVAHRTVLNWLKKARALPVFKRSIATASVGDILEVDELFTYIMLKVNEIRLWMALCCRTRQFVSFFIGDGYEDSCKRLWRKIPYGYLRCDSYSGQWKFYHCLLKRTHQMLDKQSGLTAHVERLNNTLRQRISRLVRRTLSFSKQKYMLNLHIKFFAYHYNLSLFS